MVKFFMRRDDSVLVYSTEAARESKSKPKAEPRQEQQPIRRQLTVRIERAGRGGKTVTVIEGLQSSEKERDALLKALKTQLGTGGAGRGSSLELQGDHRDAVCVYLESRGMRPKHSGR
ncbi:MAG TPA: translation initiation factor [Dissulfurispiraceae bacterium]|nr:translation initiation factor [Dissulfurispiraceae bacterium]